jgi:hypothetical protein
MTRMLALNRARLRVLLMVAGFLLVASFAAHALSIEQLEIVTKGGVRVFEVENGSIASIAANTKPLSEARVYSGAPVRGVLEVVAGTAKRYGIVPGDRVGHRLFTGR